MQCAHGTTVQFNVVIVAWSSSKSNKAAMKATAIFERVEQLAMEDCASYNHRQPRVKPQMTVMALLELTSTSEEGLFVDSRLPGTYVVNALM